MPRSLGISKDGLQLTAKVKEQYRTGEPICVPGENSRILVPEFLLNRDIHLEAFEDPLPLALVAARDPEGPMAIAATTRLSPLAGGQKLISAVFQIVGETTRHDEVRFCINMVRDNDFDPLVIDRLRGHAKSYIQKARRGYSIRLRANLKALLDGEMTPRAFVNQFFRLTEAGNLRHDVRKRLVSSLLLSKTVRPAIKFLFLENMERLPNAVAQIIVRDVLTAPDGPHMDAVKDELRWMFGENGQLDGYFSASAAGFN